MNYYASTPSADSVDIFQPEAVDIFQPSNVDIFQSASVSIFTEDAAPTLDIFNSDNGATSAETQVSIFAEGSSDLSTSDLFEKLTESLLDDSLFNLASLVESIETIYNEGV